MSAAIVIRDFEEREREAWRSYVAAKAGAMWPVATAKPAKPAIVARPSRRNSELRTMISHAALSGTSTHADIYHNRLHPIQ